MTELCTQRSSGGDREPSERCGLEYTTKVIEDIVPGMDCRAHLVRGGSELSDEPPIHMLMGFGTHIHNRAGREYIDTILGNLPDRQGVYLELTKSVRNLQLAMKLTLRA